MMITAQAGTGTKYAVTAEAVLCGRDVCVSLCGGTLHHIGAVSLACYEPERDSATVSTICVHTHRDDAVACRFAKALSRAMKCTVTVSAGLHIDNASPAEIAVFRENSGLCCQELIRQLRSHFNP